MTGVETLLVVVGLVLRLGTRWHHLGATLVGIGVAILLIEFALALLLGVSIFRWVRR